MILCSLEDAMANARERERLCGSNWVLLPADAWAAIQRLVALQSSVNEHDAHSDRLRFEALLAEAEDAAVELAA